MSAIICRQVALFEPPPVNTISSDEIPSSASRSMPCLRANEAPSAEERVAFTKGIEKTYRAEYRYYAGEGSSRAGGKEVQCLALPREVLETFYHKNAQRLMPALAESR